jgi:hypothetical protein
MRSSGHCPARPPVQQGSDLEVSLGYRIDGGLHGRGGGRLRANAGASRPARPDSGTASTAAAAAHHQRTRAGDDWVFHAEPVHQRGWGAEPVRQRDRCADPVRHSPGNAEPVAGTVGASAAHDVRRPHHAVRSGRRQRRLEGIRSRFLFRRLCRRGPAVIATRSNAGRQSAAGAAPVRGGASVVKRPQTGPAAIAVKAVASRKGYLSPTPLLAIRLR